MKPNIVELKPCVIENCRHFATTLLIAVVLDRKRQIDKLNALCQTFSKLPRKKKRTGKCACELFEGKANFLFSYECISSIHLLISQMEELKQSSLEERAAQATNYLASQPAQPASETPLCLLYTSSVCQPFSAFKEATLINSVPSSTRHLLKTMMSIIEWVLEQDSDTYCRTTDVLLQTVFKKRNFKIRKYLLCPLGKPFRKQILYPNDVIQLYFPSQNIDIF